MDTSSGRQGIPSGSRTAYLTVGQVRDWILYRESEILQEPAKDQFPISDGDIQTLQDVIAGKTVADSRSVDALLQLLAALETGRVKATGRLNRFADTSLPRSLPAHYWPHLTFTNRTPSVGWETYSQTCATLKTEPGGRFWSHLLFDAKRVLTVWPPYTVRGQPTGEEVGLLDPAAQPRHVEASRDVRKADRRLRPAPESKRIAVFRDGAQIGALSNLCAHQNGPIGEGRIIDGCVTCPWHGYQYRLEDGCAPPPFTERLVTYRVRIAHGVVEVDPRPLPPGTSAAMRYE
jgi:nitrite reductase/ring-hydroxylating ferredoxin subunit